MQINNSIFKKFSEASVLILIVKTFLFQAIEFNQTVLIQMVLFCISIVVIYI